MTLTHILAIQPCNDIINLPLTERKKNILIHIQSLVLYYSFDMHV